MLVDTSVWIDHLRRGDERLGKALDAGLVVSHPFVIGELALGHLSGGSEVLRLLQALPAAPLAHPDEVLHLIDGQSLQGRGIGYVDVSLLASARLASTTLWTRHSRLLGVARRMKLSFDEGPP